jgi:hypothetical protein
MILEQRMKMNTEAHADAQRRMLSLAADFRKFQHESTK